MRAYVNLLRTVLLLSSLLAAGSAGAGPFLAIPEPEFDFGNTPRGVKVSHVFWLHASGTDSLKIVEVNPG